MIVRVTKEFRFEMAHALPGHDGPCRSVHGHSYLLGVTLKGKPLEISGDPKNGMVLDFADLKRIVVPAIVEPFDHAIVLPGDVSGDLIAALGKQKLILTDFQPTCENLALHFVELIRHRLPPGATLHHLLLRETNSSCAEWYAEDNLC